MESSTLRIRFSARTLGANRKVCHLLQNLLLLCSGSSVVAELAHIVACMARDDGGENRADLRRGKEGGLTQHASSTDAAAASSATATTTTTGIYQRLRWIHVMRRAAVVAFAVVVIAAVPANILIIVVVIIID